MFKLIKIHRITQLFSLDPTVDEDLHIQVFMVPSATEWEQFKHVIVQRPQDFLTKISLLVHHTHLMQEDVVDFLVTFNTLSVAGVELIFSETDIQRGSSEIISVLTDHIAPKIAYPLQIRQLTEATGDIIPTSLALSDFQNTVIRNIQTKPLLATEGQIVPAYTLNSDDPLNKKIRLKALIKQKQTSSEQLVQYLPLEIQHVENIEQQMTQQVVIEDQVQMHEIQEYSGQLLGFSDIAQPLYRNKVIQCTAGNVALTNHLYDLLQLELFANLPHAIKYCSPSAAEQLSAHLPEFVSLNQNNLPQGFFLKQTALREWVLDYDAYLESEQSNPWTPSVVEIEYEAIYPIDPTPLAALLTDAHSTIQCYFASSAQLSQLINLWIKHGDDGVRSWLHGLVHHTQNKPELLAFVLKHYLIHFPQWEQFYQQDAFFISLQQISHYEDEKFKCLQNFLRNTGSSHYDLSKTVAAFNLFWQMLQLLCEEQAEPIAGINHGVWTTPAGGYPTVYMERMFVILQNARSLKEQFQCLQAINLDNYGAYYASCYEGFRMVSVDMRLNYDPMSLNAQAFNQYLKYYRLDLEELLEPFLLTYQCQQYDRHRIEASILEDDRRSYYVIENKKFRYWLLDCSPVSASPVSLRLPHRSNISSVGRSEMVSKFDGHSNLSELKANGRIKPFSEDEFIPPYQFYLSRPDGSMQLICAEKPKQSVHKTKIEKFECARFIALQKTGITVSAFCKEFTGYFDWYDLSAQFAMTMLLASHERYVANESLANIRAIIRDMTIHSEVIYSSIFALLQLYKLDIKLNQIEGCMLFYSVSCMNSLEFECLGVSKEASILKLLQQLKRNKLAVFKLFDFRNKKSNPKWPFLYALDTAEFLARDPIIATYYNNDLLLFSGLLGQTSRECYAHEVKQAQIIANLTQVQTYLHEAVIRPQPNNVQYAIQVILNARHSCTYQQFLGAFEKIATLDHFDHQAVNAILLAHQFKIHAELPQVFTEDKAHLKASIIALIILLEQQADPTMVLDEAELAQLTIAQLQNRLQLSWEKSGTLLAIVGQMKLKQIFQSIKTNTIESAFGLPTTVTLLTIIAKKVGDLVDFQDLHDFNVMNGLMHAIENIAALCQQMIQSSYVHAHEQEFIDVFSQVDFSQFDAENLYYVLSLLTTMPQRNYLSLLTSILTLIGHKDRMIMLLDHLTDLNHAYFPLEYLETFTRWLISNPTVQDFNAIKSQIMSMFLVDKQDPILDLIMTHADLSYQQIEQILRVSQNILQNRDRCSVLLLNLIQNKKLDATLAALSLIETGRQSQLLEILSKGQGHTHTQHRVDYPQLIGLLGQLSPEFFHLLYTFYQTHTISVECLLNALEHHHDSQDFASFLLEFEKMPFGPRDLRQQFSLAEVERVINQSHDLLHHDMYPYQYRKQLMEAFLFVNASGETLPVYGNKPAKDLTNAEIQSCFADLKEHRIPNLNPFQKRLLALGLMREAMYRSSGQFPYSTQMIAVIDASMHSGDFIANVDTGQGKSLIDLMKAALLWLDSDRVDYTTSSVEDAKRDIANYGQGFALLGIPYSEQPICPTSSSDDFQRAGINFSTPAQLSLFFSKAKITGQVLDHPDTRISLVMNESDYTILDDHVIYRFASSEGFSITHEQEWMYDGINEFVSTPDFLSNDSTTTRDDIANLKAYLKAKAKSLNKSTKIVDKFTHDEYLVWLESALMVNYVLQENVDYVIPDGFEQKVIHGTPVRSKVIKILMKDGKVSPDSTFGNGIQQLLYARLNRNRGSHDFMIEPLNRTLLSTNNKNFLDYYREHQGFIWGSSGTVGSSAELEEQYGKYGFEFSKTEPHQKNRVKLHEPMIAASQEAQFQQLIQELTRGVPDTNTAPSVVFCKDIDTATRLFQKLAQNNPHNFPIQLYTGLGRESDYVHAASQPGMITVTTSALGRNTDIQYNRTQGLHVWHTFVDSIRGNAQKSGRTGRQGSVGEVHFILNAQEQKDQTIATIQQEIDALAKIERHITEELYNVLGYLLTSIDRLEEERFIQDKSTFLRNAWSQFSIEIEAHYRESRRETIYNQQAFLENVLTAFGRMMDLALKTPMPALNIQSMQQAMMRKYPSKNRSKAYAKKVKLQDCCLPIDIAYHLIKFSDTDSADPNVIKPAIKAQLKQLFAHMQQDTFIAANHEYLNYLRQHPSTQAIVVAAHQEFLTEYLQQYIQPVGIIQRWVGYASKLKHMASDTNYLLMFYALTQVAQQPIVPVAMMQQIVITLLNEYLETSWFISAERKTWAQTLKTSITQVSTIQEIMQCLSQEQITVAEQDIEKNKHAFLKPLHFFGTSRYQSLLSQASHWVAAMSGDMELADPTAQLQELMVQISDQVPIDDLTLDALHDKTQAKKIDRGNASVLIHSLEWTVKNRHTAVGMCGRQRFFSTEDGSAPEEGTALRSSL